MKGRNDRREALWPKTHRKNPEQGTGARSASRWAAGVVQGVCVAGAGAKLTRVGLCRRRLWYKSPLYYQHSERGAARGGGSPVTC